MPIYFTNPGIIDIDAALTLGVNAKLGDSPIGQFGTGLKYAIAVLLRTNHTVTIHAGQTTHKFSQLTRTTRGTIYNVVCMDEAPLGFTTDLGRHWQVWQAFRELYSNAMDENGKVVERRISFTGDDTTIEVAGPEIAKVYDHRHRYFLNSSPLATHGNVEIHPGHSIFYRGILVLQCPTAFAYNLASGVDLTEDRTIGNVWSVQWDIARAIQSQPNAKYLATILANPSSLEHDFPWGSEFSSTNQELLVERANQETLPPKFQGIARSVQIKSALPNHRPFSPQEWAMVGTALTQLKYLDFDVLDNILVCDALPNNLMGLAKEGKIYLAGDIFVQGQTKVTGTILEEHLHLKHCFADMTRSFQNFLIDTIAEAAAKCQAKFLPFLVDESYTLIE